MTIIVDTDFLIAHLLLRDTNHQKAVVLFACIAQGDFGRVQLLLTVPTLGEFATIATIKIGLQRAQEATAYYASMHTLVEITPQIAQDAISLFQKQTSKENSLFDCYVMQAAKTFGADHILSFDKGYKQNGFRLLEDAI